MGLMDIITGGKNQDATDAMNKALEAMQAVKTPTADELKFQIQKLVSTGTVTPEQAQAFLQSPNVLATLNIPQTGTTAQETAIGGMEKAAAEGGLNPAEQAKIAQILAQLGTAKHGADAAVEQQQAERGTLTGGETMAAKLQANQDADVNANANAMTTAGDAYTNMLNEMTTAGTLGAGLQGQQNTQADTVGAATNAINQFNATTQNANEEANTGRKTAADLENYQEGQRLSDTNVANANTHAEKMAAIPQTIFGDEMAKAGSTADILGKQASLDTTQGGQEAQLIGGIVGTGGEVATGAMKKSRGGPIHDYLNGGVAEPGSPEEAAVVPGDSPKNDKIPAYLSEGEIVVPRTSTGSPDKVMAFLNRMRRPKPAPHPDDVASVLHAMGKVRELA